MDPNPLDHQRQFELEAIDSQINSLKESFRESLRALYQRRNELTPISSLPTEILADIILLASAHRSLLGLAWLNVAGVCRQWREIALNQSLFWSHINFSNLTLAGTAEMLARAKGAPLHLEAWVSGINWNYARCSTFNKEFQAHVSHIRHLDITAEGHGTCSILWTTLQQTLFASPAPILEYLSLSNFNPAGMLSVPNNVFKGITPRLFSLQLRRTMISWKSPLLRGLRYLKIYRLNNGYRPSITDWLDALDEMPQLKELVLHEASPLADGFTFPSDVKRTATLPVLTHLHLLSPAGACSLALAHLVLPALTSLIVEAKSFDNTGSDALILIRYLTQHAHGPQDTKPLQSVLFHGDIAYTRIVAWPTGMPDIHDMEQAERTARVVLCISCEMFEFWYHTTSTYVRVLDAAIEALPLDGLVALTAIYQARLDEHVWLRHAPRWPLLEHVRLALWAARGLREMLLLEDNGGHEGPLLPSLRQLDLIEDTSLTKRRTLRLCDALKKRVQQGVPLKVLSWSTHKWTVGAAWLLRRFVADVRGPEGSLQREEPLAWDPESCDFVDGDGDDDSDEEGEGRDDEMDEDDGDEEVQSEMVEA